MSLIAIKQHMMQVKMASLGSLCTCFGVEADTMRCLLSHWIGKGKLRQCAKTNNCGSKCFKCPTLTTEIYEWLSGSDLPIFKNI